MVASSVDAENPTREQCVFLAKLAEQAERYDEMSEVMQTLVRSTTPAVDLTAEERTLVSASFKNVTGSVRAAWRIVSAIAQKEESRGNEDKAAMARAYKSTLETRLSRACGIVLELLESNLLPSATVAEARVFYLKMKGDYHRYLAEVKAGDERKEAADCTLASYEAAQDIAHVELAPTNPIRLGLALNFSVFCYEILNQTEKASEMAKHAFEEAIAELDTLGEETYKDSTLIMQLLRDNLTIWTSDSQDQIEINPEISR